jgi:tetratricopeptide (TPR) repeat protein
MRAAAGRLAEWPPVAWRALDAALPDPDRTLALRPFLADLYQARLARTPREEPEERARLAHMLGFALSEMGRRAEALEATQEAVEIRRRLSAQRPDAFLPDLAMSLNNLGVDLSEMGRRAEALQATQEAVEIRRRLAAQHPDAFLPDLAASLNNLGVDLSEMGRRAEALQATQEAVEIRRRLSAQRPDAFLPDLAASLHNLGIRLSEMGRRAEALQATQEAVDLFRRLAAQHPDAFLPDLAMSLHNLGDRLSEIGEPEKALAAYEEAVRILLPFFRVLPPAFADRMRYMLRDYLAACGRGKREPDWELVKETLRVGLSLALSPTVTRLAPLLWAVAAMARGLAEPETSQRVEEDLAAMRQQEDWQGLAEALGRLLTGERDPQALRRGLALDAIDEQALALAEGAVADEEMWALLGRLASEAGGAE